MTILTFMAQNNFLSGFIICVLLICFGMIYNLIDGLFDKYLKFRYDLDEEIEKRIKNLNLEIKKDETDHDINVN